jgi:adenine-specific DNA-methyltransferase
MPDGKTIKLTPAKGRPMLQWVGKRPLERVTAFPAQLVEKFAPAPETKGEGLLFHGDNKDVLAWLLANGYRGKVNLVYIDPPFDSGADYVRKVELRGGNTTAKMESVSYSLGEQIQYTDIWTNDTYLQFMYERLLIIKELLSERGIIWLHCDASRGHYLKCMMDEVFGSDHFVNQIVWKRADAHSDGGQGAKHLGAVHDMIFLYTKGNEYTWNEVFLPLPASTVENWYRNIEPETGRKYNKADITGPGGPIKGNPVYDWKGITKAWRFSLEHMEELESQGKIVYSESGMPYLKRYLDESKGVSLQDWWDDISMIRGIQRRGDSHYPTEKPEKLIERILGISTVAGDLVLDCFAGSGTTAAVAQKLGRRWIIADINKGAIQTASKRLQRIISEQIETAQKRQTQPALMAEEAQPAPPPAQLAFSIYRVNDYDLQIQHNEVLNLAIEHIGIERLKGDPFFDGTLGKRLVKVIAFNHPLTRLDLQLVQDELKTRPTEDRDLVLVCLGKELTADTWLAEYNHKHPINKISVIELRTDPKYGKFFEHQPAAAEIRIARAGDRLSVEIIDFISPTILERLEMDAGVFKAKISDWRAMVDTVLIDTAYDGQVFNVALSDVPERKSDLVSGIYELPAPPAQSTVVGVKIIDMLGEEVLVAIKV